MKHEWVIYVLKWLKNKVNANQLSSSADLATKFPKTLPNIKTDKTAYKSNEEWTNTLKKKIQIKTTQN